MAPGLPACTRPALPIVRSDSQIWSLPIRRKQRSGSASWPRDTPSFPLAPGLCLCVLPSPTLSQAAETRADGPGSAHRSLLSQPGSLQCSPCKPLEHLGPYRWNDGQQKRQLQPMAPLCPRVGLQAQPASRCVGTQELGATPPAALPSPTRCQGRSPGMATGEARLANGRAGFQPCSLRGTRSPWGSSLARQQ